MLLFRIYSIWGGTRSGQHIIGMSGQVRSMSGVGRLLVFKSVKKISAGRLMLVEPVENWIVIFSNLCRECVPETQDCRVCLVHVFTSMLKRGNAGSDKNLAR